MSGSDGLDESEIKAALQHNVGMSEYESRVYLALVRGGKQSMKELADASEVPKQRVYDIVEDLREGGFVELDESYPKRAYAVKPTKTIGPVKNHLDAVEDRLEEFHDAVSDVDQGVAPFRNASTIRKYVTEAITSADRTVFVLASLDRLGTFEDALAALDDVQIRLILSDVDRQTVHDGDVRLTGPLQESANHVRATPNTEPFVLCVDRSIGFFWPAASSAHRDVQQGFYVTDDELALLLDRFIADMIWPTATPVDSDTGQSAEMFPREYFRLQDCLADLRSLHDQVPLESLTVTVDGYDTISDDQVSLEGQLSGFYYSELDGQKYLEIDVVEDGADRSRTVTVGDWNSDQEDYQAELIAIRRHEGWSSGGLDEETVANVERCRSELPAEPSTGQALVGFDGYIDSIRQLVGERKSTRMYDKIEKFDSLREMVTRATTHGKTLQFEWIENERLPGGHTAHVGQSLGSLGYDTSLIGFFGQPISDEFSDHFDPDSLVSLGQPNVTEYLQFDDGNVLFTNHENHQVLNWEVLTQYVPAEQLAQMLDGADVVSVGGWAFIPEIATVWEGIYEQVFPLLSSPPKEMVVSARGLDNLAETTIRSDLASLGGLDDDLTVTLLTIREQADHVMRAYGHETNRTLGTTTEMLRDEIDVSRVAITSTEYAAMAGIDGTTRSQSAPVSDPVVEGAVQDHFAAGIVAGRIESMSEEGTLTLGNAVAGYFKEHGETPTLDELRTFLAEYETPD